MPSFNFIAPYYDLLAGLVYGSNLDKAKKCFINQIPPNSRLLLMGGGTGAALNDILEQSPGLTVDFIEPSAAMLKIARRRLDKGFIERVQFICGDHHSIPANVSYDAVSTFFVIDCFKQPQAIEFTLTITKVLKPEGIWLFADFFDDERLIHKWIIWIMYRFFKVVAGISSNRLPDYEALFRQVEFHAVEEQHFLGGLIRSKAYRRM